MTYDAIPIADLPASAPLSAEQGGWLFLAILCVLALIAIAGME